MRPDENGQDETSLSRMQEVYRPLLDKVSQCYTQEMCVPSEILDLNYSQIDAKKIGRIWKEDCIPTVGLADLGLSIQGAHGASIKC